MDDAKPDVAEMRSRSIESAHASLVGAMEIAEQVVQGSVAFGGPRSARPIPNVPDGVEPRAVIAQLMFTAYLAANKVPAILQDAIPDVHDPGAVDLLRVCSGEGFADRLAALHAGSMRRDEVTPTDQRVTAAILGALDPTLARVAEAGSASQAFLP